MSNDVDADDWAIALSGDGEAFGRVFDRHRARLDRHCLWLLQNHADAADAVAITFFEAWRKRERVRFVDGSLLPWLLMTATNVARNQRRAARRYQAMLDRLPDPEAARDHADALDDGAALDALRELPLRDREVLVLSIIEGYSDREIAEALGIPHGTAKSRISRARARLAHRLEPSSGSLHELEAAHERL